MLNLLALLITVVGCGFLKFTQKDYTEDEHAETKIIRIIKTKRKK